MWLNWSPSITIKLQSGQNTDEDAEKASSPAALHTEHPLFPSSLHASSHFCSSFAHFMSFTLIFPLFCISFFLFPTSHLIPSSPSSVPRLTFYPSLLSSACVYSLGSSPSLFPLLVSCCSFLWLLSFPHFIPSSPVSLRSSSH